MTPPIGASVTPPGSATLERGVVRPLGGRYVELDGVELRVLVCPC